jgi:hypothetical protein
MELALTSPDLPIAAMRAGGLTLPPLPRPDLTIPDLLVALPSGDQGRLPGALWPAAAVEQDARARTRQRARRGGGRPPGSALICCRETDVAEGDALLWRWRHPLSLKGETLKGRRFGRLAYVLEAFGEPVAIAASASTPNKSVDQRFGIHRKNTVELARIARRDQAVTLAALRLWREYLAPLYAERYADSGWGDFALRAAVTYSLPGTPSSSPTAGGIYRRDGWIPVRRRKTSPPGAGSRQNAPATADIADGVTCLWVFPYDAALKADLEAHAKAERAKAELKAAA